MFGLLIVNNLLIQRVNVGRDFINLFIASENVSHIAHLGAIKIFSMGASNTLLKVPDLSCYIPIMLM